MISLCNPRDCSTQSSLSFTISQSLLKFMSIGSVMPSNHLVLCHAFSCLQSFPASFFPRVFCKSALCIRWAKYWSFSFSISPSNEHSGLISFRMDWLDLLAVQGTLKSLLQDHSLKASVTSITNYNFHFIQLLYYLQISLFNYNNKEKHRRNKDYQ